MNNREQMRVSNFHARTWLLKHGYDDIYFKPHGRRHDVVYTQRGSYKCTDFYNLFDGFCFSPSGKFVFFQVKTNRWAKTVPITDFIEKNTGVNVFAINVRTPNKKRKEYRVDARIWCMTPDGGLLEGKGVYNA